MNIPSEDIKNILVSQLGYTFGGDLFIALMPSEPDTCVVIMDTPGRDPDLTMDGRDGIKYDRPSVQIIARANSYPDGYKALQDIKDVLHGRQGAEFNGAKYTVIRAVSDIAQLKWDENNRVQVNLNFALQRTATT